MDYSPTVFLVLYNNYINSSLFFQEYNFSNCRMQIQSLQFGIRIGSIEVSRQKRRHHYVALCLQQNFSEEIHPGVITSSLSEGIPCLSTKFWYLCSPHLRRITFRNSIKGMEETLLDRVATGQLLFLLCFSYCLCDC